MSDGGRLGNPASVVIGSASGDRVAIEVLGRLHSGATDFWDGNWLLSPIEVAAGGFTGKIPASLRADELLSFREELEKAYEGFGGVARLDSMEEWLSLTVRVKRSGHVEIDGVAKDRISSGNRLSFHIADLDQTDLPALIDALAAIEAEFPVLGHR
ncbi:hypothetical protein ORV05_01255 [Amycolatopsis cynarae]|uniref:Uncharacterized protein n=1 Tax=Amycolatopsis cynarae TaxID=2995223 RepID=A0ABY7B2E4_9PSEU|nr:hypothetical protein [Amycolatopsis sp. HUAS 11-8]WAL66480.1 hypothetical protein ORV05_01255 [Amycolatopsis sp. HUAS 11-8]